jgi:hypothetical protein
MSLKEFGAIFWFCLLCIVCVIGIAYALGEARRDAAQTEDCTAVCAPYLHAFIRNDPRACYCADAEGRYVKHNSPLPENTK